MDNQNKQRKEEQASAQKLGSTATRAGLDYATGGAWEVARHAPVVGKAARGLEQHGGRIVSKPMGHYGGQVAKKLDDAGAIDALNNGMDVASGNIPQQSITQIKKDKINKQNDVGTNNLKRANSKKGLNNLFSRNKNNNQSSGTTNNNENSNENNNSSTNDDDNGLDEVVAKARKVKKVFVIVALTAPLLLIIILVASVIGAIVGPIEDFFSAFTLTDGEIKEWTIENAKAYYDELFNKEYNDLYKSPNLCNGEEINLKLIHATLIYTYYLKNEELGPGEYSGMLNSLSWARDEIIGSPSPAKCIDFTRNGDGSNRERYYDYLKNSGYFYRYYEEYLSAYAENPKTIDELLDEIFNLADMVDIASDVQTEKFIAEEATVTTADNQNNVSFKQYLSGSVYANISNNDLSNNERVKALTIASTSNILAKNNISLSTGAISLTNTTGIEYCSLSDGCSYDNNKELISGSNNIGNGNNTFNNGGYYYKVPLDNTAQNSINNAVENIYGYVLVDNSGKYVSVDLDKLSTVGGSTYQEMIKNAYGDVTIKNIRENTYISGVNFGNEKVLTNVNFYDQKNYNNVAFCGLKHSIGEYGCGITAMAMVLSTYENNNKYDPVYTMNQAYKWGQCGSGVSGTAIAYYRKQANAMGYHYLNVGKRSTSDKNLVLSHLSQGHLIVYHVLGPNIFTGGGHYMVLSGVDPETGKVYVNDPNNNSNKNNKSRKSGNGWYSFNDVIIPAGHSGNKPFHIIWKD